MPEEGRKTLAQLGEGSFMNKGLVFISLLGKNKKFQTISLIRHLESAGRGTIMALFQ